MAKGRRTRGEGTVLRRSDGRWTAQVSLGWEGGKRRRKHIYGGSKKEVAAKMRDVLAARDKGQVIPTRTQTLEAFLGTWLKDVKRHSVRAYTYQTYASLVRLHIVPKLGQVPIDKLGPDQIQRFLAEKATDGLSPGSVRHLRTLLVGALEKALVWGLVARNAAKLTDPPHVSTPKVRTLTLSESKIFLKALEGERFEALLVLALTCGLRRGEALGVNWDSLDLRKGQLQIRSAIQRLGTELQLVPTKSGKARVVMLGRRAIDALTRHRTRQLEQKLAAGSTWRDDVIPGQKGLAFTTAAGAPVEPKTLHNAFKRILLRAGLPEFSLHDLRHSCATQMMEQGVNVKVVSELLGHGSIGITMSLYQHVTPTMQESAVRMMDAALGD